MATKTTKRPANSKVLTGRVLLEQFSQPCLPLMKAAVLAGLISTLSVCAMWISFAMLANNIIINTQALPEQSILLTSFVFAACLKVISVRVQTMLGDAASLKIRSNIRKQMLALWRQQSPLAEHQQSPASAATQWVEDVEAMDGYFSRYWPQKILAIVSPFIILCVVAWVNWLCALLLLVSAPLIPLFMILVGMGAERLNQDYSITRQRLAGHFLNRVANLTTIKLFNAEQSIFDEIESRSTHYRKVIMKTLRIAFLSSAVLEFFTSVAIASLAIYIGFSLYGAITWGPAASINLFSGLLILLLAPEFFQPLRTLSQYYHDKASALGAADNLVDLFNTGEEDKEDVQTPLLPLYRSSEDKIDVPKKCKFRLKLNKVSIAYDALQVLSKPVSIDIRGNQLLAITGASGSGKTSVLNAIANYIKPVSGDIYIFPGSHGLSPIAYLPQKPWIKNASLFDNIAEFAPKASRQAITACLTELGLIDELNTRQNGLDMLLGEHGHGLSGGQMQRIALCRILLNPTPIVLLDEPSAKLDIQKKALVLNALQRLKQQAIVVVATHDQGVIDIADSRLYLDQTGAQHHAVLV